MEPLLAAEVGYMLSRGGQLLLWAPKPMFCVTIMFQ